MAETKILATGCLNLEGGHLPFWGVPTRPNPSPQGGGVQWIPREPTFKMSLVQAIAGSFAAVKGILVSAVVILRILLCVIPQYNNCVVLF